MPFVPSHIFTKHEEISNDILLNTRITVKTRLIYPERTEVCPNCIYDSKSKKSSGRYKTGGPISFTYGLCPYCHGVGKINTPSGDDIQLRVYYDKASFRKIASVDIPEGDAMCIGLIKYLPDIRRAQYIIPSYEIKEYGERKYVLESEPLPWGLSKDKYFVAHLTRDI